MNRLVAEAKAIKVGDPEEEDVFMGALNSKPHLEKVRRYMDYAVEDGGQGRELSAVIVLHYDLIISSTEILYIDNRIL